METEKGQTPIAKAPGLGRLTLLMIASVLGIAGFWHAMYGVDVIYGSVVVGEVGVILVLAFAYAWRSTR